MTKIDDQQPRVIAILMKAADMKLTRPGGCSGIYAALVVPLGKGPDLAQVHALTCDPRRNCSGARTRRTVSGGPERRTQRNQFCSGKTQPRMVQCGCYHGRTLHRISAI